MKTTFIYQPNMESERLLVRYHYLATGLYQEQGFLVLPYRLAKNPKSVYLPEISGFKPTHFLAEFKNLAPAIPLVKNPATNRLLAALKKTGFKPETIDQKTTKKVEKDWQLIQSQFEDYFLDLFPQYRQHQINLRVYWSRYGTLVSFSGQIRKKKAEIKLFLRDDMGIAQIAEGFLSGFFEPTLKKEAQLSWLQREAISDFLLQETKLARLFPDFVPTLKPKNNLQKLQKYSQDSARYLKKIGFVAKPGLSIFKNQVLVNGQLPKHQFTASEEEILKRLVITPNEPVSYFDLGDLIWKDDLDKFSLWALSRLIFKIRNKLRKNGLSPEHIKNLRGQGYYYTSQP